MGELGEEETPVSHTPLPPESMLDTEVSSSGSVSRASSHQKNQDTGQNRWLVEMWQRRLDSTPLV